MIKIILSLILALTSTQCFAMRQVLTSGDSGTATTTTSYNFLNGNGAAWGGIGVGQNQRRTLVPVSGTLTNLRVVLLTAPGAGKTRTITVRVNGSSSSLACTVSDTNTTCQSSVIINVTAGDYVSLQNSASATATSSRVRTSVVLNGGSVKTFSLVGGIGAETLSFSNSTYPVIHSGAGLEPTVAIDAQSLMPISGTVRAMYLNCFGPGAGRTWTFTAIKNGSDQSMVCTMANPATTCSDTTHSFTFNAGDTLNVRADADIAAADPGTNCGIGMVVDSANKGIFPFIYNSKSALSASASRFSGINADNAIQVTESNVYSPLQTATITQPLEIRDIYALLETAPGSGKSYTVTLDSTGSPPSTGLTISDTSTSGNLTGSYNPSNDDLMSNAVVPSGTPATGKISVSYLNFLKQRRVF